MQPPKLILSAEPIDGSAADDHSISRTLLDQVAAGEIAGALRIWRPVPALALTRVDELRPGATDATMAASRAGLPTVVRMSGGHAVVLGTGSLCAGLAEPASTFEVIGERYERFRDAVAAALTDAGITVEHGALEGEWCPGPWSLRSGQVKLAGLAQRAIKGSAWIEAVIELAPDPRARQLLIDVYGALELPLDDTTLGSLAEVLGAPVAFEATELERPGITTRYLGPLVASRREPETVSRHTSHHPLEASQPKASGKSSYLANAA